MIDLNSLLKAAVAEGASDIHLKIGKPPIVRRDGSLGPLEGFMPLDENALTASLQKVAGHAPIRLQGFYDPGDLAISYQDETLPRFSVNANSQPVAISFASRVSL